MVIVAPCPYATINAHGTAFGSDKMEPQTQKFLNSIHEHLFKYMTKESFDQMCSSADFSSWLKQGILMINNSITRTSERMHTGLWEDFMKEIYIELSTSHKKLPILLYGKPTFEVEKYFDNNGHKVWKIEQKEIETSKAFAEAYDFIDANLGFVLRDAEMHEMAKKLKFVTFDPFKDVKDEQIFASLKKFVLEHKVPYFNSMVDIKYWKDHIRELLPKIRILFNLKN